MCGFVNAGQDETGNEGGDGDDGALESKQVQRDEA